MDQIKPLIDGMKKHWFWIFCGLTLIACTVVYYIANGGIYKQEQDRIAAIKQTDSTAKSLQNAGVDVSPKDDSGKDGGAGVDLKRHPNEETTEQMKLVLAKAAAATGSAWRSKVQDARGDSGLSQEGNRSCKFRFSCTASRRIDHI